MELLAIAIVFGTGFAAGYGLRAYISHRRRWRHVWSGGVLLVAAAAAIVPNGPGGPAAELERGRTCRLSPGTAPSVQSFRRQEEKMIKALLTPVLLGLAVAMVIRLATRPAS
jgi:hypothetical protein